MRAFDLQDTLVHIDYKNALTSAANPTVLYGPIGDFMIISAQQLGRIRVILRSTIERLYPNCSRVVFVSGSERQIIEAKARAIREYGVTEFTDNNEAILAALKELVPNVKLYKANNGSRSIYK